MIQKEIIEQIKSGARVRVWERLKEADGKERQSAFEGVVLARRHGKEAGATFTVRATVAEVGVEKVYPIHSPTIAKIEIISSPKKVHRAKLFFLRSFSAKKMRERLNS